MTTALSAFTDAHHHSGASLETIGGVRLAASFGAAAEEYQAARADAALFDRSDRGLLRIHGVDRARWLHNLVTNAILPLSAGRGCYTFAVNLKGRILFEANVLSAEDSLWLDLPLAAVALAAAHFDRYLLTEDVRIADRSGQTARLACIGPAAGRIAQALGGVKLAQLPALGHVPVEDDVRLIRCELAGLTGFELVVPRGRAGEWWDRLATLGARPAGWRVLDVLRIEAGVPWLGRELTDEVLPAETGLFEQAVSTRKGCFLGHEVIERMRSRGMQAQRLVRMQLDDGRDLDLPAVVQRDGQAVGRVTSLAAHPSRTHWVALGYLKSVVTGYAGLTAGATPRAVTVCSA